MRGPPKDLLDLGRQPLSDVQRRDTLRAPHQTDQNRYALPEDELGGAHELDAHGEADLRPYGAPLESADAELEPAIDAPEDHPMHDGSSSRRTRLPGDEPQDAGAGIQDCEGPEGTRHRDRDRQLVARIEAT